MKKMEIEKLRKDIDQLDDDLLNILSKRKQIAKEIGKIKKKKGTDILDSDRESELIKRVMGKSADLGLDEDNVKLIFEMILEDSKKEQKGI
jgi:chorismate mutase